MKKAFKTFSTYALVFLVLLNLQASFFAAHAQQVEAFCASVNIIDPENPPSVAAMICPLVRILNILFFAAAAVFAIMVAYGGIKMNLAMGDPKGFESAKLTIFYAFMGLFVCLGAGTIVIILSNLLGVTTFKNTNDLLAGFLCNFKNLMSALGITDPRLNDVGC